MPRRRQILIRLAHLRKVEHAVDHRSNPAQLDETRKILGHRAAADHDAGEMLGAAEEGDRIERVYRWVAPDESLAHLESAKWIRQNVPAERIAMRVDNLVAMVDAVAAGIGVGLLLVQLGDARRELVRIEEPLPQMDTQVWVLTHPDVKHVGRIRALTDFLFERLSADPRLDHGTAPPPRRR